MRVFVFDLLPYGENLDHVKERLELPWPLPGRHFTPEVAVRTYAEHLDAWEEIDRIGYDGVAFNEHHTTPFGLMNSPNLMAAAAAQRTKRLKLLIYGNLLPLHNPIRLAEEIAMLDCLSNGRIISGFARGIPREYNVFGVPMPESRARFEEAWEIVRGVWTEEVFSYEGKFWSFRNISIWPRPVQQPYPPVWVPILSSKETIEWAARYDIPITPGLGAAGVREDISRYYAECLAREGRLLTSDHLIIQASAYVADSKAQAVREAGPYELYFNHTLFNHGNVTDPTIQRQAGYLSATSADYMRGNHLAEVVRPTAELRRMTMADVERDAEHRPWGTPDEVRERLIAAADEAGANTILISLNRGAMPQDMFLEQIRRFGDEVLPALQAHKVKARDWSASTPAGS
jgi:alkanesulfonate monooxygenase SsuD/methylene tetrahydromethanopterin reductase-like flavin-dependent oxidoreductase (luciferase family)